MVKTEAVLLYLLAECMFLVTLLAMKPIQHSVTCQRGDLDKIMTPAQELIRCHCECRV